MEKYPSGKRNFVGAGFVWCFPRQLRMIQVESCERGRRTEPCELPVTIATVPNHIFHRITAKSFYFTPKLWRGEHIYRFERSYINRKWVLSENNL